MLVIDCYNVLHAEMPPELAGLTEAGLCMAVRGAGMAERGVRVVVDGGATVNSPLADDISPVEVLYSGHAATADDVIIRLIATSTAPRRLTVVSSDRAIRDAARRRRCRTLSSDAFIQRLTEAVRGRRRPQPPTRSGPSTPGSVRHWLEAFGFAEEAREATRDAARLDTPDARPWQAEDDEHWPPK